MTDPGAGPASSPRRDQTLAALAAELRAAREKHRRDVEQLRADLAGLSTLVGENADLLGQALPRVAGLDEELADLGERVDALAVAIAAYGGADPAEPDAALVDWPSLSAEDAAEEWQVLGDWVARVLGPFYELTRTQLPDCWALHRPAVLELVWLRRAYVTAHSPDALASAAADWHTRWCREALANIAAAISDKWCRPGQHWVDRHDQSRYTAGPPQPQRRAPAREPGQRPGPEDTAIGMAGEITSPQHWGPAFRTASGEDLAWRRQRDAAAAAAPPGS
jgi:hypothetical protein